MCQICLDNCRKHIPEVSDNDSFDFLMEFTCFPFGSAKMVEDQLITLVYKKYLGELYGSCR